MKVDLNKKARKIIKKTTTKFCLIKMTLNEHSLKKECSKQI